MSHFIFFLHIKNQNIFKKKTQTPLMKPPPPPPAIWSVRTVYNYIVYSWWVCESNCGKANSFLFCLISQNRILMSQNIVLNFKYLWYILRIYEFDFVISQYFNRDCGITNLILLHHNIVAILWWTTKSNLSFETSQNGVNINVDISFPKSYNYGALVMSLYS